MALKELWLARAKVGQNAHWFQPKSIFFQRYRSLLFAFDRLVRSGTAHRRRCVIVLAIREDLLRLKLCPQSSSQLLCQTSCPGKILIGDALRSLAGERG